MTGATEKSVAASKLRRNQKFSTKELALVSVLSSLWIVSQIYLGPVIGQLTQVHGVVQRFFGWFLMLILALLTGRFGRVTAMASITSLATRIIRPGQIYSLFVGLGYALGGLTFDLLFFLPKARRFGGNTARVYLLSISAVSAAVASIPYLLFKLWTLGYFGFMFWVPLYSYEMARSTVLSVLGTLVGISIAPKIEMWAPKIMENNAPFPHVSGSRENET